MAQPAAKPEAAGQLAGVWHDRDEALLKEVISDVALLSVGVTSTIFNTLKKILELILYYHCHLKDNPFLKFSNGGYEN